MPELRTPVAALRKWSEEKPDSVAFISVGDEQTTWRTLMAGIDSLSAALAARGIDSASRVAMVVPNGPSAARAFLGVSATSVAAPLNPAATEDELVAAYDLLSPSAVLTTAAAGAAVRDSARRAGLPVLDLHEDGTLGTAAGGVPPAAAPDLDDVALVLPTSGTTARPKLVPLTHRNLAHSAHNIGETLGLTQADRCLNMMPLFHIHGLMAALLASLVAGGQVVCAPGFVPDGFRGWLRATRPTWYTAVPTIHQAVLDLYRDASAAGHGLRFVRSSSSALPAPVLTGLERVFGVPVIEAYGMTEAAHQMTSNALPPAARKAGSVGRPNGLEVAVLEPAGSGLLATGQRGEVGVRGPNITRGYWDAPEANAASFTADGWFRTGDEGFLDEDGHLFLTGRIKELINRGGEKIAPREIEEALLRLAGVREAVAFAVPHSSLGEDIGLALVPSAGAELTEQAVREYARERLAHFKIPRHVLVLSEIPKGPTGKVQRATLAARFGLPGATTGPRPDLSRTPRSPLEVELLGLLRATAGVTGVGVLDDFVAAGCDSLQATRLLAAIRDRHGVALTVGDFYRIGTVERLALTVTARQLAALGDVDLNALVADSSTDAADASGRVG